jgi:hypothetical protein
MKKSILYAAILSLLIFAACKKNNDKPSSPSLAGKWSLVNENIIDVENGIGVDTINYTGTPADYVDFRSDHKVYSSVATITDTSAYQILNNNKVVIDIDTFDIQSLTATSASLYSKVFDDDSTYSKITLNLKR